MTLSILHEDEDILVIDKPPFMVVNRAESVKEKTLQDIIDESFDYPLAHNSDLRNGVVHRLDKDTSGVMVLAKTPQAMSELQRQFHDRETKKTYTALVHGWFLAKEGIISVPMDRSFHDRQKFVVSVEGRMTETHYRVIQEYQGLIDSKLMGKGYQGFSLVELQPKTGRTHQIRVIMTHLKHPLVGDVKYVGRKRAKADVLWCNRHFLHARSLGLYHPQSKKYMVFESPLPEDLARVLLLLQDRQ